MQVAPEGLEEHFYCGVFRLEKKMRNIFVAVIPAPWTDRLFVVPRAKT
jgi:hypothetical protein